jgi:phosphate transport system substrate-binding protein
VLLFCAAAGVAACSSTTTTSTSPPDTGTAGGTAATPANAVDLSSLSGTLNGSGSTFQAPFNEAVIDALKDPAPNLTVNYNAVGSGQGKTDLQGKVTAFAGSDSTVKPEDMPKYQGGAILYFPTVAAPITVSYNLSGVTNLQLSPSTLAKIFSGTIKTWNDPAIAADNPGVTLPSTNITRAVRSDGSGTTNNFTSYLKAAAGADWTLGAGDTITWPAGSTAGKGNGGVAQTVKSTDGAIGYVDFADAKGAGLTFASIKNQAGKFVAPSLDATTAALTHVTLNPDLTYTAYNQPGDTSYPIVSPTYIIVYANQTDATQGKNLKGFLQYVLTDGQGLAAQANFAKLTDNIDSKAVAQLDAIKVG